jgi:hypothetical protein
MALTSQFFAAKTVTNLVTSINAFLAAEPLTTQIHTLSVVAHDLARFTGIEFRAELLYDPVGGEALATPFYLLALEEDQLPLLQQVTNAALAAAPDEMWLALPFLVQDSARRLDRNLALFLRNVDPSAINNIALPTGGDIVRQVTTADTPVLAMFGNLIVAEATGAPVGVMLPSAVVGRGQKITIIKVDATADTVDLFPMPPETINGAPGHTLPNQWDSVVLQSDGANWLITASA